MIVKHIDNLKHSMPIDAVSYFITNSNASVDLLSTKVKQSISCYGLKRIKNNHSTLYFLYYLENSILNQLYFNLNPTNYVN